MKKIQWHELIVISGSVVSGWLIKSLMLKKEMSDWWLLPFVIVVCLLFSWIDIKPRKGQ
ncbi:hypothetical protein ABER99_21415 [Paenibacillus glucanolyticus]|jgi:hypothetical protein|uniref:hypothetical protein n=1 Tax=Paenibacillus TaxID=44249 RepID=UPI000B247B8D|nr:hypothetical protein [Paenibacillus glucanolyticus]